MQGSKIMLSEAELTLFTNAEIILTKNSILQKTILLLTSVQELMVDIAASEGYPFSASPKISKGENYEGLPYVILDYPRLSTGADLYFVRSLFWWGNFYSSTLQLGGENRKRSLAKLKNQYASLLKTDYFIGINPHPWEHHFKTYNYKKINTISFEEYTAILDESHHIKIAAFWPISAWDTAANTLMKSWVFLTGLVA